MQYLDNQTEFDRAGLVIREIEKMLQSLYDYPEPKNKKDKEKYQQERNLVLSYYRNCWRELGNLRYKLNEIKREKR